MLLLPLASARLAQAQRPLAQGEKYNNNNWTIRTSYDTYFVQRTTYTNNENANDCAFSQHNVCASNQRQHNKNILRVITKRASPRGPIVVIKCMKCFLKREKNGKKIYRKTEMDRSFIHFDSCGRWKGHIIIIAQLHNNTLHVNTCDWALAAQHTQSHIHILLCVFLAFVRPSTDMLPNIYVCTRQIINEIVLRETAVIAGQNVEYKLQSILWRV